MSADALARALAREKSDLADSRFRQACLACREAHERASLAQEELDRQKETLKLAAFTVAHAYAVAARAEKRRERLRLIAVAAEKEAAK